MIIKFEGVDYDCDDELSFKDFTGWDFRDRPEYDFNNKFIYGSCFAQEELDRDIFGGSLTNTTFIKGNLDNVFLGDMAFKNINTHSCSKRRIQIQNDLRDWEIDRSNKPIKVTNEKYWTMKQISVDPKYIPKEKILLERIITVKDADNNDVQVVEQLDYEKTIKEKIDAEIKKVEDAVIDVPIDPIKEVKP